MRMLERRDVYWDIMTANTFGRCSWTQGGAVSGKREGTSGLKPLPLMPRESLRLWKEKRLWQGGRVEWAKRHKRTPRICSPYMGLCKRPPSLSRLCSASDCKLAALTVAVATLSNRHLITPSCPCVVRPSPLTHTTRAPHLLHGIISLPETGPVTFSSNLIEAIHVLSTSRCTVQYTMRYHSCPSAIHATSHAASTFAHPR